MFTKQQARAFFAGMTLLFSAIFLWLTIDTMRRVPAQTREHELTPQAIAGKHIWEKNNCMGCHTLFGEGAYYAPELTRVVERRGAEWMKVFLRDPQAMFPGQRRMVQYNFKPEEIDNLIAFFTWAGNVDLNGFPAKPPLREQMVPVSAPTALVSRREQPAMYKSLCVACHSIGGQGGIVGPSLDQAYQRKSAAEMKAWLADPPSIKPGTLMPKLPLSEQNINELVDYLQSFGQGGQS